MSGACSMQDSDEKCIQHFGQKNLNWRPRRRWEDNIRADLREIGWNGVDWTHLAQDRDWWLTLMSTVVNLQFQ